MDRRWLRIAHRGASGTTPEHTRPAFERALAVGVDMIEIDVQLTRDGQLVVIHDDELQRTTTGRGLVREHTLAEVKALDAGSWFGPTFAGEPVLTLDEVLELLDGRAHLNVEVKGAAADFAAVSKRLTGVLRARGLMGATLLSSFETGALVELRDQAADARLGVLWQQSDFSDAWRLAEELGAESIHPHWLLVSSDVVTTAHDRRLRVLAWTVNAVEDMRELVGLGVDGIMSDYPERFAAVGGTQGRSG